MRDAIVPLRLVLRPSPFVGNGWRSEPEDIGEFESVQICLPAVVESPAVRIAFECRESSDRKSWVVSAEAGVAPEDCDPVLVTMRCSSRWLRVVASAEPCAVTPGVDLPDELVLTGYGVRRAP